MQSFPIFTSKKNAWICWIDLKDAYFCVPLLQKNQKYIRFCWEGHLFEFLCLCFDLGPAPWIFTKLLKISVAILQRINIRIAIYLEDVLLMSQTIEGLNMATDTLICSDIEKAFLQIRIRESQRDALRFHWVSNFDLNGIEVNCFTRLVFGLTQSLLILESTLKECFNNYKSVSPELIENIRNNMYVEGILPLGETSYMR